MWISHYIYSSYLHRLLLAMTVSQTLLVLITLTVLRSTSWHFVECLLTMTYFKFFLLLESGYRFRG